MCKIRGRDIGFHLVTCDKTAVPTRKREVEFDNMVLGYALVYLIFQAPQVSHSAFLKPPILVRAETYSPAIAKSSKVFAFSFLATV